MKLSNFTQGKNNNFNLIRIIAALAVLVGHSFALLNQAEPLAASLGMSLGSIAVDLFFIASGFLVAGSLLSRQNLAEYVWARVLRIYPALLLMLLLTVFGLGALLTSLPLASYYFDPQLYSYLMKCLTLVTGAAYYLPGVFENNPYPRAVNGSLWTMVYEVKMYIFLGLFFWLSRVAKKQREMLLCALILTSAAVSAVLVFIHHFYLLDESQAVRLFFMFFSGAAYWLLKERIRLSGLIFSLLGIALLASGALSQQLFFAVYQLGIGYILFYLAYVPAGWIRKYNAAGDYSYGVYIYAFPVQQSVLAWYPGMSAWALMGWSALITLALAIASWHLIEQRALALKRRLLALPGERLYQGQLSS